VQSRADAAVERQVGPSLSALRDPVGAREVVARVVLEALELPPEAWARGAGVPFEARWTERLGTTEAEELARCARSWLAGEPPGGVDRRPGVA
jgi:hypothetical protein